MNERIKQLARTAREQMVVLTAVDDEQWRRHEEFVEKFAQLIVRECIDVIGEDSYKMLTGVAYCTELKRHFGVEE